MTNNEAIKVLLNEWKCIDRNDGINCNRKCESCDLVMDSAVLKDAYNLAIKALEESKPHWIPCSERLPEENGEMYLVTISDGAIYSATLQWDINRKRWYLSFLNNGEILIDYIDDVIAWMPLPEPYREGES